MKTGKLKAKIKKVSTLEEGLDEILQQAPQPTGIVLFGADSDLKEETFARCKHNFPQVITGYGGKNGNMATLAKQTAALECNPPATDEMDYLLEVTSE